MGQDQLYKESSREKGRYVWRGDGGRGVGGGVGGGEKVNHSTEFRNSFLHKFNHRHRTQQYIR